MSPEPTALAPALVDWLRRADHEPGRDWSLDPPLTELRCHPDLVARLAEVARPVGALARATPLEIGIDPDWAELDPWAVDVAFARSTDLLRAPVARAYERAEPPEAGR